MTQHAIVNTYCQFHEIILCAKCERNHEVCKHDIKALWTIVETDDSKLAWATQDLPRYATATLTIPLMHFLTPNNDGGKWIDRFVAAFASDKVDNSFLTCTNKNKTCKNNLDAL